LNRTRLQPALELGEACSIGYDQVAVNDPGTRSARDRGRMKNLIVYHIDGEWIGEEVTWKRSGSGFYRETSRIWIPQSKSEIEKFAAENNFKIEWRGEIPTEAETGASV
jgi:hypothetical protein